MKKILSLFVAAVMAVGAMAQVTFDFSDASGFGYTNPAKGEFTQVEDGEQITFGNVVLTVNFSQGNGFRFFSNTNTGVINLRGYKDARLTVSTKNGANITGIEFAGSNLTSTYVTADGYDGAEKTWAGEANLVTFNIIKSTVQINTLTVTTSEGGEVVCTDNYGLMVNDQFVRGTKGEAIGGGEQWEVENLSLTTTDVISLYSLCGEVAFTGTIMQGADLVEANDMTFSVKEDGIYNFYLKIAYENNEIYITKTEVTYSTVADINTAANGTEMTLCEFDVVFSSGAYTYIMDASGAMSLIYKANYGLKAGDHVAAGMVGNVSIYNNLPEFVPTTAFDNLTITESTITFNPADAAGVPVEAEMNSIFMYRGVTLGTEDKRSIVGIYNGEEITFYDRLDLVDGTNAESTYTIMGAVAKFKENMQVYILTIAEEGGESTGIDTINGEAQAEGKMMIDGQLYILRDGRLYNAQGAVVR